ncbi:hypothetical protein Sp245p_02895 [Azospirillum baldaniorum]|uniref:Uncharacterized protein n=1 Tax=Azospirillum baldaniorum TaxID=1064539 RepID=A0A9P1JTJ6_9PROT|nr:hypothetical protein [Azospirillum baldaniorum]AWJ88802.1 hypothetical protein Sp245p_02895 [Azospirillum baldaniorum]TWA73491.1 hypothetical protein FBZ85_116185 [Azospirillum brasilense]CCC99509.1 protein of unknown function [Azospirillum baldaniorum]
MSTQPLLFDSLPETERARKPARRSRASTVAAPVAVDVLREDVPSPSVPPPMTLALVPPPPVPMAPRADFDPAALTNAELRALAQALPDHKLAHLLIEAARELKRRAAPGAASGAWEEDEGEDGPSEPNPLLLRAARQAVGELSGEDG